MQQVRVRDRRAIAVKRACELRRLEACCDERGPPGTLNDYAKEHHTPNTSDYRLFTVERAEPV
jgi:hypothetical protein